MRRSDSSSNSTPPDAWQDDIVHGLYHHRTTLLFDSTTPRVLLLDSVIHPYANVCLHGIGDWRWAPALYPGLSVWALHVISLLGPRLSRCVHEPRHTNVVLSTKSSSR